jgi:hypothetical protein
MDEIFYVFWHSQWWETLIQFYSQNFHAIFFFFSFLRHWVQAVSIIANSSILKISLTIDNYLRVRSQKEGYTILTPVETKDNMGNPIKIAGWIGESHVRGGDLNAADTFEVVRPKSASDSLLWIVLCRLPFCNEYQPWIESERMAFCP